ncbi:hypothetical protein B0H14DRAFT_2565551 [Mycena olivaceomarginata]|nr:hypothetical protein B0H14DRAFT_2565551 [Mycena olivaceomarginata]
MAEHWFSVRMKAVWGSEDCAQMTSEAAVFPVSVTSDNVHCSCPFLQGAFHQGAPQSSNINSLRECAVDFSLLDNIFVVQGSSVKVLFIDNSAIMGLDLKHLSGNCLSF